jgi:hypothetical protein
VGKLIVNPRNRPTLRVLQALQCFFMAPQKPGEIACDEGGGRRLLVKSGHSKTRNPTKAVGCYRGDHITSSQVAKFTMPLQSDCDLG